MSDDVFVLDSLTHSLNLSEENIADEVPARMVIEAIVAVAENTDSKYDCPRKTMVRDWSVDDTANVLFRESVTSVAVYNPQPIFIFKD
ncbi:MAG: hypothetical protein QOJ62_3165, partial [Actinomycetota bacterium]|nr:hypothetical protein [Actinomycetota bacterium]